MDVFWNTSFINPLYQSILELSLKGFLDSNLWKLAERNLMSRVWEQLKESVQKDILLVQKKITRHRPLCIDNILNSQTNNLCCLRKMIKRQL